MVFWLLKVIYREVTVFPPRRGRGLFWLVLSFSLDDHLLLFMFRLMMPRGVPPPSVVCPHPHLNLQQPQPAALSPHWTGSPPPQVRVRFLKSHFEHVCCWTTGMEFSSPAAAPVTSLTENICDGRLTSDNNNQVTTGQQVNIQSEKARGQSDVMNNSIKGEQITTLRYTAECSTAERTSCFLQRSPPSCSVEPPHLSVTQTPQALRSTP